MIQREIRGAALLFAASLGLSFVVYEVLQSDSYLAGVGVLALAIAGAVFSSVILHAMEAERRRSTSRKTVVVTAVSAAAALTVVMNLGPKPACGCVFGVYEVLGAGEAQRTALPQAPITMIRDGVTGFGRTNYSLRTKGCPNTSTPSSAMR